MKDQIKNAKAHFSRHKELYIGIGVGVVVGGATALILKEHINISQIVIGSNNNLSQTTVLVRRGHPGNILRCDQTGELFASQNRAASLLNLSPTSLARHLKGETPHVKGFTFTKLGEAT